VYPFVWNILLAARNEGYGGVLTTMAVAEEPRLKELLGLCRLADYADRGVTVLVDGGDRGRVVGIIPAL
jgi:hypothetical protein